MLIKATYKDSTIVADHVHRIDDLLSYNKHLRKDDNNGWTKDKSMRHVAKVDELTLKDYAKFHPGWAERMTQTKDKDDQKKAWIEFCASAWGYGVLVVDKMVH